MGSVVPFEQVLAGVAAGHTSDENRVDRKMFVRIIGLLRGRIGRRYAGKVEAEDIANAALFSFFGRYKVTPYPLGDWEELWSLLATIAVRKMLNAFEWYDAEKRAVDDCERERAARAAGARPKPRSSPPDERVVMAELMDKLLTGFTDAERRMIELSLNGWAVADVVAELGYCKRTVIRARTKFQARLEAERDAGRTLVE